MPTDCIRSCHLRNYNSSRMVNHYYILLYFMSYIEYFITFAIFLLKHINCCPSQAFVISIQLYLVWVEKPNSYEIITWHLSTAAAERVCRSVTHPLDIYLSVTFHWPNLLVLITCFRQTETIFCHKLWKYSFECGVAFSYFLVATHIV